MDKYNFALEQHTFGEGHGPSVVITGGIHGDEQTGSHTARLVIRMLKSARVPGRVTVIPFCNLEATRARRRQAPADELDLNRIFPGKEDGTYSQQLARHIWDLTAGYDYLLDLHCCGGYGSTYGMSYYTRHAWAPELLDALHLRTVVHTKGTRGQLYIEAAERRGQKGLLIELPGGQPGGFVRLDAAEECARGVWNYLIHTGAVEGEETPWGQTRLCSDFRNDFGKAWKDGLFEPFIEPGTTVRAGQTVALLDGEPFVAPEDGVVTMIHPLHYTFRDAPVVRLTALRPVQPGEIPYQEAKD